MGGCARNGRNWRKPWRGGCKTITGCWWGCNLEHLEFLDASIARLDAAITERLRPCEEEIAHLASRAGLCPGNQQSGGTRRNAKNRKRSPFLRRALVEAGHVAARKKGSYFDERYRNLAVRRGQPKDPVAIGDEILVRADHYWCIRRTTRRSISRFTRNAGAPAWRSVLSSNSRPWATR